MSIEHEIAEKLDQLKEAIEAARDAQIAALKERAERAEAELDELRATVGVRGVLREATHNALRDERDALRAELEAAQKELAGLRQFAPGPLADPSPDVADKHAIGLYRKFHVERTDGKSAPGEKHHECEYFVLDITHDEFAPCALAAYASACSVKYPVLSKDLRDKLLAQLALAPAPDVAEILAEADKQLKAWDYPRTDGTSGSEIVLCEVTARLRNTLARVVADLSTEREHSAVLSSQLNTEIPRLVAERDALAEKLAMHQRDACYICGSKRILSRASGCGQCGAPVCCQTCCEATTLESKLDSLKKSKDAVVQTWMNLHDEAVERAEQAEQERDALKAKADYCCVCGNTVASPPCPHAGDDLSPCTWPAKCEARIREVEAERDALRAECERLRGAIGYLAPSMTDEECIELLAKAEPDPLSDEQIQEMVEFAKTGLTKEQRLRKAENDALRAELDALGPVEWQFREHPSVQLWQSCSEKLAMRKQSDGTEVQAIRRVLAPAQEGGAA